MRSHVMAKDALHVKVSVVMNAFELMALIVAEVTCGVVHTGDLNWQLNVSGCVLVPWNTKD